MDIVERLRRINAFLHVTEDKPEYDYKLSYEAADEIERLREALFVIEGWYPTDVSNPHNQIKKMKELAHLALNGDFQKYVADHYAALEEGE